MDNRQKLDREVNSELAIQYEQRKAASDDTLVLQTYEKCVRYLKYENYQRGLQRVENTVRDFFDADCVVLVRWKADNCVGIEEVHKASANRTAKVFRETVAHSSTEWFRELIHSDGSIYLWDVRDIMERCPNSYHWLVGCRTWSVIGHELRDGIFSEGVLFVTNPRKHLAERDLVRLVADYVMVRMLRQQLMEAREYDRSHDLLTRLWNRGSFLLWSSRWEDYEYDSMGIVTTDIVALSTLNKELGYAAGNRCLVSAAQVFTDIFEGYRVFRYDEDEMLVFCPNIKKKDFMFIIKCLQEKIEELDFALAMGYSWRSNVNVRDQITESEDVMKNDKLRLVENSAIDQRIEHSVTDEVKRYIQEGKYLVYLQPKVNIYTRETVGAEALIRQMDSELGMVSPAAFIPVLERYNSIHYVDLFVLEEVFKYQKKLLDNNQKVVPISVNFSKMTILQPDLIERVCDLTQKYDIPKGLIVIEVTETVGDMDHVVIDNVANRLKTLGFQLSMDDFGTHYSNLAVLIQYDFDSAKIDRSMVLEITTNRKSQIVLDYMTALIDELGIKCVVEGIETKEQIDILKTTKCHVVQGFYFGKPVPKEEFYGRFILDNMAYIT